MKNRRHFNQWPRRKSAALRWLYLAASLVVAERQARLLANPAGLVVVTGSASTQTSGSQLNVTVSSAALLNWSSFNIQAGETTTFLQPSANSVVLNNIGDANPSQIFGSLKANGTVILANASGFYFGPHSMISVGGSFIATTAPIMPDFGIGSAWQFTGLPPLAGIVNYGQIQAGNGCSLYLIAEDIQNNGGLNAPGGSVGLYAGQSVLVSESPDGRGLSATVKVPSGAVDNLGHLTADAGTIAMQAQVVNQNGVIQANSVQEQNGVVELVASDSLTLGPNSTISAQGDGSSPGSAGGTITLKSGNTFSDSTGSQITTAGGAQGGNGGNIEVSAPNILSLNSGMDASAQAGWLGGSFLLDPASIILDTSGTGTAPASGTVSAGSSGTLDLDVNTAFANKSFSQILLQATGNITLSQNTAWNLSNSTGETSGQLTLEAGDDIIFGNGAQIKDLNDWSVTLDAGYSFTQNAVQSGVGSIFLGNASTSTVNGQTVYTALNNSGSIWTSEGSVTLNAGQDILVGSGYVITKGGGNITADALAGSINAGTANAYGTSLQSIANPGGINTFAGGNVTLTAGNSIISIPNAPGQDVPGSSGTYGLGSVTLTAGDLIEGNFQVADGVGTILAGVSLDNGQPQILNPAAVAGNSVKPLTLSLASGSWNVWSASDTFIEEVRNLNGTYGSSGLYTYAADATLNVWAAGGITLDGLNLVGNRNGNISEPVYPPIMTLAAGAGGITLNSPIILFPSSVGALQITTSAGGSLTGNSTSSSSAGITMSDGNPLDYTTFDLGYSDPPLHADDPNPVVVDISGSINNFSLTVPTFADIQVGGNAADFDFLGQNLSASQTTSINVAGTISYRGDLTSQPLADPLPAAVLNPALSGLPAELLSKFYFDATTGQLIYVGAMSLAEENLLLNPTIIELDQYGQPVLDANGNPETVPVTLDATQTAAITQLYGASQSANLNDQGLGVTGPGHFKISADSIDLATSGGIYANTTLAANPALAAISPVGADITVTTSGNLEMTASEIANAGWLGGINLNVGGTLDVGGVESTISLGDVSIPKGIFTESGGNIFVQSQGDVNVNSSRIAAFNGGGVTVESATGNVNAGTGGTGSVNVDAVQYDPATGLLDAIPTVGIGGSGILATTIPGSDAQLGNVLVETPKGNITASQGGILQISLNGTPDSTAIAALLAGYELVDTQGNLAPASALTDPTAQTILVTPNENVDASGSGIVAQNVLAKASGEAQGLFVGFNSVNLDANQIGPGVAFGPKVTITDSGPSDSGGGPTITVIAENPVDVNNSIQQPTAPQTVSATKEVATTADNATTAAANSGDSGDDLDAKKKKAKPIGLAQRVSRVTVLLPQRN